MKGIYSVSNENRHINRDSFLINKKNVKMIMNFNAINEWAATSDVKVAEFFDDEPRLSFSEKK